LLLICTFITLVTFNGVIFKEEKCNDRTNYSIEWVIAVANETENNIFSGIFIWIKRKNGLYSSGNFRFLFKLRGEARGYASEKHEVSSCAGLAPQQDISRRDEKCHVAPAREITHTSKAGQNILLKYLKYKILLILVFELQNTKYFQSCDLKYKIQNTFKSFIWSIKYFYKIQNIFNPVF